MSPCITSFGSFFNISVLFYGLSEEEGRVKASCGGATLDFYRRVDSFEAWSLLLGFGSLKVRRTWMSTCTFCYKIFGYLWSTLLPRLASLTTSLGAAPATSDYLLEEAENCFEISVVDLLPDGWLLPLLPLPAAAC